MKTCKYIAIAMLGAAALSLTSCKDFFDTKSPSSMDKADIFSNASRTEGAMLGIYHVFGEDRSYRNRLACGHQAVNTDIEYCTKKNDKLPKPWAVYNCGLTDVDLVNADNKDPWNYINAQIERCNNLIEGVQEYADMDNPVFQYYLGEGLTMRAFLYMELIKLWGDVPARFTSLAKDPESMNIPKTDRNVIFEQLRRDLTQAAELLPWSSACPGAAASSTERMNKAFALGLLARLDLTYAGYALRPDYMQQGGGAPYGVQLNTQDASLRKQLYAEAVSACEQIMNEGTEDAKFMDNFADVFKAICADETNYYKSESLWEIPFGTGRGQVMNYNTAKGSEAYKALKNNTSGSTNAAIAVIPTLYYDYDQSDLRRDVTILPYIWSTSMPEWDLETTFPGTTDKGRMYQKMQSFDDLYLGKYRIEWMTRERTGNDDGINFLIMRYTDVLLMYCEATLGGITGDVPDNANLSRAQQQFDRVRSRAGLASATLNMDNLMDERKFEFCGEYLRKYDLMRWGKLKEKLVETRDRLNKMIAHDQEAGFAQLCDTVWYKYRRLTETEAADYLYTGDDAVADCVYVLDSVWGFNLGENTRPATYSSSLGWHSKSRMQDKTGYFLAPNVYFLYEDEDLIDKRHYFPIFTKDVGKSNGTLWNDYDY